jgi:cholesterol transport system auxiliary component
MTGFRRIAAGAARAGLCAAALALAVLGCVPNLPGLTDPAPNIYSLSPKNTFRTDLPNVNWQLIIEEPSAAGGLDSNRITLMPTPFELRYFQGTRWTDRAPRMVQTLLIESFENTGRIVAVGRQTAGLRSDYNLKSELREFQAEYFHGKPKPSIRVVLSAKLIRQPRQDIVASRNFEHRIEANGTKIEDVIEAFDEALNKVLRQIVEWTLTTGNEYFSSSL